MTLNNSDSLESAKAFIPGFSAKLVNPLNAAATHAAHTVICNAWWL